MSRMIRVFHAGPLDPERVAWSGDERSVTCRLETPDGCRLCVRAVRADAPVHPSLAGCAAATLGEWADQRVALLRHLQRHGYRAPRVLPALDGAYHGDVEGWWVYATSFVEGSLVEPTTAQLRLVGEALGALHALPVDGEGAKPPGWCSWHPARVVPATLDRLDAVAALLPQPWRELHAAFSAAVESIRSHAGQLPEAVCHADVWPANCVQTGPHEVTLIDWDAAGCGPAVVDLTWGAVCWSATWTVRCPLASRTALRIG
jgi:aminoglycoside phosphotransferase (APT) family kinase protein